MLAQALDEDFYTDIGEWLSELIRLALAQDSVQPDYTGPSCLGMSGKNTEKQR